MRGCAPPSKIRLQYIFNLIFRHEYLTLRLNIKTTSAMPPTIYHLSTCSTCKKIIASLNNGAGFVLQDIKTSPLTPEQLDALHAVVGSYEALFSRKAMKYRALNLAERALTEADYRQLILDEYTFLKRPVVTIGGQVFVGNSKAAVEGAQAAIQNSGL